MMGRKVPAFASQVSINAGRKVIQWYPSRVNTAAPTHATTSTSEPLLYSLYNSVAQAAQRRCTVKFVDFSSMIRGCVASKACSFKPADLRGRLSKLRKPRQTAAKCTPTIDIIELRNVAEAAANAGAKVLPVHAFTSRVSLLASLQSTFLCLLSPGLSSPAGCAHIDHWLPTSQPLVRYIPR